MRLLNFMVLMTAMGANVYASEFRLGGAAGYGESSVTVPGVVRNENPLGIDLFFDYAVSPKVNFGAERFMTFYMSPISTNVGYTNFTGRWYFVSSQPVILPSESEGISKTMLIRKALVPYLGGALGYAQASIPKRVQTEPDALAAGPYLELKLGVDYPISGSLGGRCELGFGAGFGGQGQIESIHLIFGLYTYL